MARICPALALMFTLLCGTIAAATPPLPDKEYFVTIAYPSFNPFGAYRLWASTPEDIPRGLEKFGGFEVWLASKRKIRGRYKVVTRVTAEYSTLDFATFNMTSNGISFTTETLQDGTSYSFQGRFLRKGDFNKIPSQFPVAEGTLTKFVNGKKVAEGLVKLDQYIPD